MVGRLGYKATKFTSNITRGSSSLGSSGKRSEYPSFGTESLAIKANDIQMDDAFVVASKILYFSIIYTESESVHALFKASLIFFHSEQLLVPIMPSEDPVFAKERFIAAFLRIIAGRSEIQFAFRDIRIYQTRNNS